MSYRDQIAKTLESHNRTAQNQRPLTCKRNIGTQKHNAHRNGANDDEFTVKVATAPKEIAALLETGFEYIMTKEDLAYFRKRK